VWAVTRLLQELSVGSLQLVRVPSARWSQWGRWLGNRWSVNRCIGINPLRRWFGRDLRWQRYRFARHTSYSWPQASEKVGPESGGQRRRRTKGSARKHQQSHIEVLALLRRQQWLAGDNLVYPWKGYGLTYLCKGVQTSEKVADHLLVIAAVGSA